MNDQVHRNGVDYVGRIVAAHPLIFKGHRPDRCHLPAGWYSLVDELCLEIEAALSPEDLQQLTVLQFKEKFGTLSFYVSVYGRQDAHIGIISLNSVQKASVLGDGVVGDALDRVRALGQKACVQSATVCQKCGNQGRTQNRGGCIASLCETHATGSELMRQSRLVDACSGDNVLLFLDFDGCMHPLRTDYESSQSETHFCHLARLESILRLFPQIQVVISSAWRFDYTLDQLRERFSEDLRVRVISTTTLDCTFNPWVTREAEILRWLIENERWLDHQWLAIDDAVGQFDAHIDRLIACDGRRGFGEDEAAVMILMLDQMRGATDGSTKP